MSVFQCCFHKETSIYQESNCYSEVKSFFLCGLLMCQRGMQMAEGDRGREGLAERREEVRMGKERKEH